jgi:hypothetical protein
VREPRCVEVRARGDGGRGIDLQKCQPLDDLEQVGRSRRVEELRANRNAPRLRLRQPVHVERLDPNRDWTGHTRMSTQLSAAAFCFCTFWTCIVLNEKARSSSSFVP